MNITFIVESYYPSVGGVQSVTKYLAEGLAKKKHNVTIITTKKDYIEQEEINGVTVRRFDLRKNKVKKYYGEIDKYITYVIYRNDDYTIFECSENITTDLMLPYLPKINGKKILHLHGCYGLTIKPFSLKETISKTIGNFYNYIYWNKYYFPHFLSKYINYFDATISLSEIDSSNIFLDKYFRGKRYILGNAVDDIFFKEIEETSNIDYNFRYKKYFLSVANFRTIKNQIEILKQYSKSKCKENYDLVFIGAYKNKYYERLLKTKEKLNLKNVHILVGVPRKDIPKIMRNAYAYIVGSTYEEFSISLIEAMASETPFISTNVGNARLLPGGIVIDNINEMSNKLDLIVQKPDIYLKLARDAKKFVNENCKIETNIERLIEILNKI